MEQEVADRKANKRAGNRLPVARMILLPDFRDGCCNTGPSDIGMHTVCVVMTEDFGIRQVGRE